MDNEKVQSIGSRLGDIAYLAAVCFLAYIKILTNWQVMSLMGGFAAARYAVKAIKENKNSAKEIITTAINAATNISGQMQANPASIRPPPRDPPDDPSNKITREIPEQKNIRQSTPGPLPIPRVDSPEGRGRYKRIILEWAPILFPIGFTLLTTLLFTIVNKEVLAAVLQ